MASLMTGPINRCQPDGKIECIIFKAFNPFGSTIIWDVSLLDLTETPPTVVQRKSQFVEPFSTIEEEFEIEPDIFAFHLKATGPNDRLPNAALVASTVLGPSALPVSPPPFALTGATVVLPAGLFFGADLYDFIPNCPDPEPPESDDDK